MVGRARRPRLRSRRELGPVAAAAPRDRSSGLSPRNTRVLRAVDWAVVAVVAAFPLLIADATVLGGSAGRFYAVVVLVGAAGLGVLETPRLLRRLRARSGLRTVWAARALWVWALVVAAAFVTGGSGGLLFLLTVPVVSAALVLPAVGVAGLLGVSVAAAVVVGVPDADRWAVWIVTVVGVGALTGSGLRQLEDETARRRRLQAQATRRAELLNVVATTSLASHGLEEGTVVTAVVNGALGLGLRSAVVFEPDLQARVYRCRESVGLPADAVGEVYPLDDADAIGAAVRSERPVVAAGGEGDPAVPPGLAGLGFVCAWAVPVFVEDDVVAVLCVLDGDRRRPAEDEVVTLGILADRLGDALAHGRRVALREQAIDRLREAERLKDDFVSTLSHELRTPATVIKAANELLFTRWDQLPDEIRVQLREKIDGHADQLASLLDSMLAYRDLDAGRLQPDLRAVDLSTLVEPVRSRVDTRGEDADRVDWQVDGQVSVMADPAAIRRVLSALVDNALIHTASGTRVTVSARRRGESVRVVVADDGPGMHPEQLDAWRRPFTRQGDVLRRDTRGLGLGLTIAGLILDGHGQQLTVDSHPGQGTRCTFHLAVPAPEAEAKERLITLPDARLRAGTGR